MRHQILILGDEDGAVVDAAELQHNIAHIRAKMINWEHENDNQENKGDNESYREMEHDLHRMERSLKRCKVRWLQDSLNDSVCRNVYSGYIMANAHGHEITPNLHIYLVYVSH